LKRSPLSRVVVGPGEAGGEAVVACVGGVAVVVGGVVVVVGGVVVVVVVSVVLCCASTVDGASHDARRARLAKTTRAATTSHNKTCIRSVMSFLRWFQPIQA
jgi:hypothetical protein